MQATRRRAAGLPPAMHLLPRLLADDGLEVAHHGGIGVRAGDRADDVEGVFDVGDPVAQRLVHGVLEGARAGVDRLAPRPPAASCGTRWAAAARCRLRPCRSCRADRSSAQTVAVATPCWPAPVSAMMRRLAHAPGQQDLADAVVDLVRAGMVQLVALEVDLGAAELLAVSRSAK